MTSLPTILIPAIGVIIAALKIIELLEDGKHEKTKQLCQKLWQFLQSSGWNKLPQNVIRWLLINVEKYEGFLEKFNSNIVVAILVDLYVIISGIVLFIENLGVTPMSIPLVVLYTLSVGSILLWEHALAQVVVAYRSGLILKEKEVTLQLFCFTINTTVRKLLQLSLFLVIYRAMLSFIAVFFTISFASYLDFYPAWLFLFFLIPIVPRLLFYPLALIFTPLMEFLIGERFRSLKITNTLASSFALSFFITYLAAFIGFQYPNASLFPISLQILISNAVFDTLTIFTTIVLLTFAVKKLSFPLHLAISLDILFSSLYACLSLYVGLLDSPSHISFLQSANVFLGKSPSGESFFLGPYFWIMHTTLIPTIAYLLILALASLAKGFYIVMAVFFKKFTEHSNPINLAIGFLGLVLAILLLIEKAISS